ncbi:MAG: hypothetical protein OJF50_001402 [Nitrospira sp.]|nr:hypothetical protein [Nitrospira sp.]
MDGTTDETDLAMEMDWRSAETMKIGRGLLECEPPERGDHTIANGTLQKTSRTSGSME